jgi:SAM-dependent methyltransferase
MVQEHTYHQKRSAIWGGPYRLAVSLWRRSPKWFRSALYGSSLKNASRDFLAKFAKRDDLYGEYYYTHMDAIAMRSAPAIVDSVFSRFGPERVIDVGCGSGALLAGLKEKGVSVVGLEYSKAALDVCGKRGLEVYQFNIEEAQQADLGHFNLAMCFEVAEHISAAHADALVEMLVGFAPRVVFTAATPGQGGTDHVNEQPHEYWIEKFEHRGYPLLSAVTEEWREEWRQKDVAGCYRRNVMVFEMKKSD